jgi:hypothetical protein
MESEPDEDTVVRPRAVPLPPADDDADADTIIRGRTPFADVPVEALVELREAQPAAQASRGTEPVDEVVGEFSFSINHNPPIRLDVAALVGRRPALPRIMSGRAPRLVRVPSPLREVSSTHLELRQQGALVIVTDLRSTNGSIVTVPGRDPVKLHQGESVVVMPGTVVDIGDGNLVEILGHDARQDNAN